MSHGGALPDIKRYITTHNSEGKAVFSDALPEDNVIKPVDAQIGFALTYTTSGFPVNLNGDADIAKYKDNLENQKPLALANKNGSVLRVVDFAPNLKHAMHRTVSIDYGIVLEGETVCVLDSGERRHMKRGDVCVQRGTFHAWENASETEWARMIFVLLDSEPLQVNGETFGQDLGTMERK